MHVRGVDDAKVAEAKVLWAALDGVAVSASGDAAEAGQTTHQGWWHPGTSLISRSAFFTAVYDFVNMSFEELEPANRVLRWCGLGKVRVKVVLVSAFASRVKRQQG